MPARESPTHLGLGQRERHLRELVLDHRPGNINRAVGQVRQHVARWHGDHVRLAQTLGQPRRRQHEHVGRQLRGDTVEGDPRQWLIGRRGRSLHERHRQGTGRLGRGRDRGWDRRGLRLESLGPLDAFGPLDPFGSLDAFSSLDAFGPFARDPLRLPTGAFERSRSRIRARRDLVEHRVPVRRRGRQRRGGGPRQRRRRRTIQLDRHPRTDTTAPGEHHERRDHQMNGRRRRVRPQRPDEGAGKRHRMGERQRQRGRETETGVHAARGHRPAEAASRRGVAQGDQRQHQIEGRRRPGHGPQRHDQVAAEILFEQHGGRTAAQRAHDQRAKDTSDTNPVPLPGHRYTACSSSGRLFFA